MIIEHGVAKARTLDHNPAMEKLAGISGLLGCVVGGAGFLLTREKAGGRYAVGFSLQLPAHQRLRFHRVFEAILPAYG
jgi:hypothetical protein